MLAIAAPYPETGIALLLIALPKSARAVDRLSLPGNVLFLARLFSLHLKADRLERQDLQVRSLTDTDLVVSNLLPRYKSTPAKRHAQMTEKMGLHYTSVT